MANIRTVAQVTITTSTKARDMIHNPERDGITGEQLHACKAEERDGTRLPGCVKTYLPQPAGRCGMVLRLKVDEHGPFLFCLAFGVRHPPRDSRAPSVYQVADRRLNAPPDA